MHIIISVVRLLISIFLGFIQLLTALVAMLFVFGGFTGVLSLIERNAPLDVYLRLIPLGFIIFSILGLIFWSASSVRKTMYKTDNEKPDADEIIGTF